MGKPTGFMEYTRKLPGDRTPLERIMDWNEFHYKLPETEQRQQGARCMDCGIPFCHSGIQRGPVTIGCPLSNLIPEWNDLIYHGKWKEAVTRLLKTNNFPEFTGRVCPALCEGACTVGISEPQITIKNNECTIIDRAFQEGWITPQPPKFRTGKKVAVVGSGPSGLAAAAQLNKAGHWVTVFERSDRPGGLLMYGIPNMKLDKKVVLRRISIMSEEGISFRTNTEVGKDISSEQLLNEYDAVILACGATKPRDLPVEGRELKGIHFAVNFLHKNTKSLLDSNLKDGQNISASNKDVVIIGGGDTGTDCVGTALRHGCRSVIQFEIMPPSPEQRDASEPWPVFPRIFKVDYGQEEAMEVFGSDPREFLITTKKFVGDEDGNVKEIHTVKVEWKKDDAGRMIPVEIPGSEKVWPAQLVLLAMGFLGPDDQLPDQLGVKRDPRSNVSADYGKYKTSIDKVFAAGDVRRGQSLVVWAIHEGRGAARECDKFLMGNTTLP
jgi:glutamate synthase (NADPH/NADH) small chain